MSADIIIYAIVAAVLVGILRNTLGTRHGDERQRPNPLTPAADRQVDARAPSAPPTPVSGEPESSSTLRTRHSVSDEAVERELYRIADLDRSFDPSTFVRSAGDAFVMVVEAFARGDRRTLKDLLTPRVYDAFDQALSGREDRGESVETEIHAVKTAEIIGASVEERTAFVTVRFTAEETCVVRDSEGEILSGNPDRITEMTDVWVFSRDLRSRDPVWYVHETREDVKEEHKTPLPDTGA